METLSVWFFKVLTLIFTIGWIGCLLTIPMAAYKFVSVLFEKDSEEPEKHQEFVSAQPSLK
jgi:hypothetical protein